MYEAEAEVGKRRNKWNEHMRRSSMKAILFNDDENILYMLEHVADR